MPGTTLLGFLAPCRNSEKPNDPIPKKHLDRWKNGQTLFHRTLLASARGPSRTTAVDWQLKVKDIDCDVGLTKNYCITLSM